MSVMAAALAVLVLQNGAIQGRVMKAGAAHPLSKAKVQLRMHDDVLVESARTEEDGRFAFGNVRPGLYKLVVTRQGYVRQPLAVILAAGQQTLNVELPMAPSAAIYGRVYQANGEPL